MLVLAVVAETEATKNGLKVMYNQYDESMSVWPLKINKYRGDCMNVTADFSGIDSDKRCEYRFFAEVNKARVRKSCEWYST